MALGGAGGADGGVDFRFRDSKLWHLVAVVGVVVGLISDFEILSFGTWWWWWWWWWGRGVDFRLRDSKLWHLVAVVGVVAWWG